MIKIKHSESFISLYEHLSPEFLVQQGDFVTRGEIIARVGPLYVDDGKLNGATTGPHLHLGIIQNGKLVNPLALYHND